MNDGLDKILTDFVRIAKLSGVPVSKRKIMVEILNAPHNSPACLPDGKMAVYAFFLKDECLKVGKVGPNSHARYASQHYSPKSSNSNLAKSLLNDRKLPQIYRLKETNISSWIKKNTDRVNFLLDADLNIPVLTLFESFLQCRLNPRFEGFESQSIKRSKKRQGCA